ncbi:UNVERIFIED_CONTAM: hypothetical protein GTU68_048885 [Idotea baltica]|nr:hypothetical protein [Idotea baltica]
MSSADTPKAIRLRDQGSTLVLEYPDRSSQELSAEYLRVNSPSAEVQGHFGEGGELPVGKENVRISQIEKSGHYAIRLHFDDTHDSGIFTWAYLWQLAKEKNQRWQDYLIELRKRGEARNPEVQVVKLIDPKNL